MEFALESMFSEPKATYDLWRAHWDETEVAYRAAPLNPDIQQFLRLEELGRSRYFTARENGVLAGHLYFIVHPDRHTQTLTAVEDFFFFLPAYRKGGNALKLLRFAVDTLKAEGVLQVGMSSKLTGKKDIDPFLKRVGFRHVANFYVI